VPVLRANLRTFVLLLVHSTTFYVSWVLVEVSLTLELASISLSMSSSRSSSSYCNAEMGDCFYDEFPLFGIFVVSC
jgi:hypothetical protein